ncbi:hypothetical protein MC885_009940 [Smutsia gigantea]|nr:hypothetical protein MC885_009940 [Smutsia gigantea]
MLLVPQSLEQGRVSTQSPSAETRPAPPLPRPPRGGPALGRLKNQNCRSGGYAVNGIERLCGYPWRPRRPHPPAAMASKGLQDLKQQVEGAAQEAVTAAGTAVQQMVDQATDAGQKALYQVAKSTQETTDKTANEALETFSGFGKKFGLLK